MEDWKNFESRERRFSVKTQKEITLELATHYHKGQTRWDKNIPYITHPIAVSDSARDYFQNKHFGWFSQVYIYLNRPGEADVIDIIEAVSLGHDILEDTIATSEILRSSGLNEEVIKSIEAITKKADKSESYLDYIMRVKKNPVARIVKICDITHNLTDLKNGSMRDKYFLAKYILEN